LKFEDQFNFVDSPLGQIVIYNSNSNLYLASCLTIKELFIPERVDKCTEDIPVIIKNESENRIVYLTKQGILRYHSNLRECMDENEYFETNNVQIVRRNNFITTIQKISKKIRYFGSIDKNRLTRMQKYLMFFLDFYRKHFGTNEQFLITRDLTVIFAVIITIIIIITKIIINNKHPISDLLIFLFSIHKYLKKKGKVELDIESDSQAIMCKKKTELASEVNIKDKGLVCAQEINQKEQRIDIENEINELKCLKKVSSNIDLIVDSIDSNNITERYNHNSKIIRNFCNCKGGCKNNRCKCRRDKKTCNFSCHHFGTNCSNK
jgi:hypothetical protein